MVRALFTCLAVLAVASLCADDKKFDASKLDGKWTIVKGMKNGQEGGDDMKKTEIEIAKDTLSLEGAQGKFKFKFKLDDKQSPVAIDMEMTESPFGAGMKAKGIVSLEGDDFKLCYAPEGDRPKKFDGKEAFYFELKRKK
jgi:uncharacterized protein (TIGR03067 family)